MQAAQLGREAFLRRCHAAARELDAVVRPSIGPLGLDVLVQAAGKLVVCSSGRAALALTKVDRSDGPLRLLRSLLDGLDRQVGDGTSALCLSLAAALAALPDRPAALSAMRMALLELQAGWLRSEAFKAALVNDLGVAVSGLDAVQALTATALRGQFAPRAEAELCAFVVAWVNAVRAPLPQALRALAREAEWALVTAAPCAPPSLALVPSDAVLLDAAPLHRVRARLRPEPRAADQPLSVVVMFCSPAPVQASNGEAVRVRSGAELADALTFVARRVEETLRALLAAVPDLGLLVCTDELPDPALEILTAAGALAVQLAPRAQARLLCQRCGLREAHGTAELLAAPQDYTCQATAVREVKLSETAFAVLVEGLQLRPHGLVVPQVLLKAASGGLAAQYKAAVARVLRLLAAWAGGPVLAGGAACELWLYRRLLSDAAACEREGRADAARARKLVAQAVLAVPLAVAAGSESLVGQALRAPVHQRLAVDAAGLGEMELRPAVEEPATSVEPLALKEAQLEQLLQGLCSLLRIDGVLVRNK